MILPSRTEQSPSSFRFLISFTAASADAPLRGMVSHTPEHDYRKPIVIKIIKTHKE